jgi:hypothetical protein
MHGTASVFERCSLQMPSELAAALELASPTIAPAMGGPELPPR